MELLEGIEDTMPGTRYEDDHAQLGKTASIK